MGATHLLLTGKAMTVQTVASPKVSLSKRNKPMCYMDFALYHITPRDSRKPATAQRFSSASLMKAM
ncbi:MAG: hypothetical protein J6V87_08275 [Prevotella sp.]|nr:hypothetical protein [Prevotella sp.]